jgi:hypothetical protein
MAGAAILGARIGAGLKKPLPLDLDIARKVGILGAIVEVIRRSDLRVIGFAICF